MNENWFNKLTRTNEEHGEYYCLMGSKCLIVSIDEDVDGLTYYYPKTKGERGTGDSRYFHLPDRYYITVVGNSKDIEALTKDARFVKSIHWTETNNLNYRFDLALGQCNIDEDGEEIPEDYDACEAEW
tara:strand:- start:157 stop:540 length:384 start_codon:yes stop_codon:yes gene_type:complete